MNCEKTHIDNECYREVKSDSANTWIGKLYYDKEKTKIKAEGTFKKMDTKIIDKGSFKDKDVCAVHCELIGQGKIYHKNGKLAYDGNFDVGYIDGETVLYGSQHPSKPNSVIINIHNLQGECTTYFESGKIKEKGRFDLGNLVKGQTYYEHGELKTDGHHDYVDYDQCSTLKYGTYINFSPVYLLDANDLECDVFDLYDLDYKKNDGIEQYPTYLYNKIIYKGEFNDTLQLHGRGQIIVGNTVYKNGMFENGKLMVSMTDLEKSMNMLKIADKYDKKLTELKKKY